MSWNLFNGSQPVELAPDTQSRVNSKVDRYYYAWITSCLQRLVQIFNPSSAPVSSSQAVQDTVKELRNSTTPAVIRTYNHGPDPVTVIYGDLAPTHDTIGSSTLAKDEWDESPRPIIGKVRAICGAGHQAVVTTTEFPA